MIEHQKKVRDYSTYTGIIVIYLVSALVAFTVIIPDEEIWYWGIVKALIWPLYTIAKLAKTKD